MSLHLKRTENRKLEALILTSTLHQFANQCKYLGQVRAWESLGQLPPLQTVVNTNAEIQAWGRGDDGKGKGTSHKQKPWKAVSCKMHMSLFHSSAQSSVSPLRVFAVLLERGQSHQKRPLCLRLDLTLQHSEGSWYHRKAMKPLGGGASPEESFVIGTMSLKSISRRQPFSHFLFPGFHGKAISSAMFFCHYSTKATGSSDHGLNKHFLLKSLFLWSLSQLRKAN